MTNLTGITFTGVDEYTDLDRLQKIQEKYRTIKPKKT